MAETKKKTNPTANKKGTTTNKKPNNSKSTNTNTKAKPKTTTKATTSTAKKTTSTAKKGATSNTAKKTTNTQAVKKTTKKPQTTTAKKATPKKTVVPKPVEVKEPEVVIEEVTPTVETNLTKEEVKIVEKHVELEKQKDDKISKRVDLGILTVIIGLFLLVLTTYLSSEMDLTIETTRILIIVSLVIEAIGMLVMIVNIWKRK